MKNNCIRNVSKLYMLCITILIVSCSKDDETSVIPVNNAPVIKDQSFNASEAIKDDVVFGTVTATDADKDELSYSITANSNDLFEITKTGNLSLTAGKTLDFEATISYEITVEVTDGKAKASAKMTITVSDELENHRPVISVQFFTVAEDATNTTVIGTVVATDPDGDTLTFTIEESDNPNTPFEITTDGVLNIASSKVLDFEYKSNYTVKVQVTDVHGAKNSKSMNIEVTDVAEKGDADYSVSTLAGSGVSGFADGTGTSARLWSPLGIDIDRHGTMYVADYNNHRIRKITSRGVVTTLAGSGVSGFADGTGTAAQFSFPYGIAVDANDNVYVSDYGNHRIRKITPSGVVTTLAGSGTSGSADGTGTAAQFNEPYGLDVDATGTIYVADYGNHRIRKITPSGVVTTFAGSTSGFAEGTGTAAMFKNPSDVVADANGNVYVSDTFNNRIRNITSSGTVSTFAGSGAAGFANATGTIANFKNPSGITIDTDGNLYVAENSNHSIRKITSAGVVSILAGTNESNYQDGTGATAKFMQPVGIVINNSGVIYVTDETNHRIRKINIPRI